MEIDDIGIEDGALVVATDPYYFYPERFYRATLIRRQPIGSGGMKYLVKYHYRANNAFQWVRDLKPDDIGDPFEWSLDKRIEYKPLAGFDLTTVDANPPGVYVVYGPCPLCGKYVANYTAHEREETFGDMLDDVFSDRDLQGIADIMGFEGINDVADFLRDEDENNNLPNEYNRMQGNN